MTLFVIIFPRDDFWHQLHNILASIHLSKSSASEPGSTLIIETVLFDSRSSMVFVEAVVLSVMSVMSKVQYMQRVMVAEWTQGSTFRLLRERLCLLEVNCLYSIRS